MSENEKMGELETEQVVGGVRDGSEDAKKADSPRLIDDGNVGGLRLNPVHEYTCENCGKKYKFRQPGMVGSQSAIMRVCPYCGK